MDFKLAIYTYIYIYIANAVGNQTLNKTDHIWRFCLEQKEKYWQFKNSILSPQICIGGVNTAGTRMILPTATTRKCACIVLALQSTEAGGEERSDGDDASRIHALY